MALAVQNIQPISPLHLQMINPKLLVSVSAFVYGIRTTVNELKRGAQEIWQKRRFAYQSRKKLHATIVPGIEIVEENGHPACRH